MSFLKKTSPWFLGTKQKILMDSTGLKQGEHMGVSENSGTSKSSILIGFSIINHPFWGTPIFGNTHIENFRKLLCNRKLRWMAFFLGVGRGFSSRIADGIAEEPNKSLGTVDGKNPAPVDMVNIPLFTGFYTSQVVQDFFHQRYVCQWLAGWLKRGWKVPFFFGDPGTTAITVMLYMWKTFGSFLVANVGLKWSKPFFV